MTTFPLNLADRNHASHCASGSRVFEKSAAVPARLWRHVRPIMEHKEKGPKYFKHRQKHSLKANKNLLSTDFQTVMKTPPKGVTGEGWFQWRGRRLQQHAVALALTPMTARSACPWNVSERPHGIARLQQRSSPLNQRPSCAREDRVTWPAAGLPFFCLTGGCVSLFRRTCILVPAPTDHWRPSRECLATAAPARGRAECLPNLGMPAHQWQTQQ